MIGYPVIDADGHLTEPMTAYRERIPEPYSSARELFPQDGWDRDLGRMGHRVADPERELADIDAEGIDSAVLFPTAGLSIGNVRDPARARVLATAYNQWLHEFCSASPDRIKGVGIVGLQEVESAVEELERLVEFGMVAVQVPTYVAWRKLSDRELDPFYAAVERLDVPIAVHSQPRDAAGSDRFDKFLSIHAVTHPFEQMIAMTQLIFGGVLERYPKLRVGSWSRAPAGCPTGWTGWMRSGRSAATWRRRSARARPASTCVAAGAISAWSARSSPFPTPSATSATAACCIHRTTRTGTRIGPIRWRSCASATTSPRRTSTASCARMPLISMACR